MTAARVRKLLAVALAYYVRARLGLELSLVADSVTPLWPPTGIAVAAFVVLGRWVWPAVAVAAFAVNLPLSDSVFAALATAAGNTLAPLAAALLLQRLGFRRQLDRQRDALAIIVAALSCTLISATIGSGALALSDAIPRERLPTAWAVWWTGDTMGVLAVTPFLLSLLLFRELPPLAGGSGSSSRRSSSSWFSRHDVGGPVAAGALPGAPRRGLGGLAAAAAGRRTGGPPRVPHRHVDRYRPIRSLPGPAAPGADPHTARLQRLRRPDVLRAGCPGQ